MNRVGWFGGTFDPIHNGHLDVATAAQRALGLDDVAFVPSNVPPHRATPRASGPDRLTMTCVAVLGHEGLSVSDLEMRSMDPSYTSTTLDRLSAQGLNTRELFLITGADAFRDIATWRDYPAILDRCHFVVVSRPSCPVSSLRSVLPALSGRMIETPCDASELDRPRIILVDSPTAPVSSTEIRRRVAAGESIAGMTPDAVIKHIDQHHLYAAH